MTATARDGFNGMGALFQSQLVAAIVPISASPISHAMVHLAGRLAFFAGIRAMSV